MVHQYVVVLPNTCAIPYYNFESTHFMYFQYKRHKLKHKNSEYSFYFQQVIIQLKNVFHILIH